MTKKTVLSVLMVAGLLFGGAGLAAAQRGDGAGRGHHGHHRGRGHFFSEEAMERRLTHMTERLSLDAHQVGLVREILADARTRAMALRESTERGPARREQLRALMEETSGRIDAVLNETQRTEFAEMRGEMRARHAARRERREDRREERREHRGEGRGRGAPEGI